MRTPKLLPLSDWIEMSGIDIGGSRSACSAPGRPHRFGYCAADAVDHDMVSVSSTNFDIRSFRLNDEASLNIYDRAFAECMTLVFEADRE